MGALRQAVTWSRMPGSSPQYRADPARLPEVISPELRRYVADAVDCAPLLAAQLATIEIDALREALRCTEAATLRLLICDAPGIASWDRDVTLIASYAGVDARRLDRLLRQVGAGDRTDWPRLLGQPASQLIGNARSRPSVHHGRLETG